MLWNLWLARNAQIYERTSHFFSTEMTTNEATELLFAVCSRCQPEPKLTRLRKARWWLELDG